MSAIFAGCVALVGGVAEKITNLDEQSRAAQERQIIESHVTWGSARNGVKVGLYLQSLYDEHSGGGPASTSNLTDWLVTPAFLGLETNEIIMWLPPERFRCELKLQLLNGREIPKTKLGKRFQGAPLEIGDGKLQSNGFVYQRSSAKNVTVCGPGIRLQRLFEINREGDYRLIV